MKKRKEKIYYYEAIFDPNGSGYTVTVPKLPGLVTEGDNLKEAREMVKDAIRCYLKSILKSDDLTAVSSLAKRRKIKVAF